MNTIKIGLRSLSRRLRDSLQVGVFILLAFISIITYGWQCGELGVKEYTLYPYSWTSGSSDTGVITTSYTGTLTGTVNPGGVETSVYFEWGSIYGWTSTSPRSVGNGNVDVTITQSVTNLLSNTTYYYRLAIVRGNDLTYTENQSFTTPGRPSCTTEIATNVSSLSATLNGIVNPNGLTTTAYFQWGLSYSFGNTTAGQSIGSGAVQVYVAANISGLSAFNTYFFRVVAVNLEGTVYGETRTFNSGPPSPFAFTSAASSVTYNSAVLNGAVNPNNQATTINFQWGQDTTYGDITSSQIIPAGANYVQVTANLTGLSANTTYYFRLTARNPAGDSYGAQQSFTTPPPPPIATTTSVATATYNSAILTATVNPNGLATTALFQWGTSTAYGSSTSIQSIGSGITSVSITATITGLLGSTTYNYRVVATNSSDTTYGSNQSFTTSVAPPTATTNPATGIGAFTATLNALVNPNSAATTAYFEYGTTITYGSSTAPIIVGSGAGFVIIQQTLTGLSSSATYYFRIVAINGTGPTTAPGLQFTTSAEPPTVITLPASDVTTTTGTLNATVNPNGATTTAFFQWGTTPVYSTTTWATSLYPENIGNGRTTITVTPVSFSTLLPATTLYYRIAATNAAGTFYGTILSFTTPADVPSAITFPASNITSANAQLNGTLNSNGLATTVYYQWGLTANYTASWWNSPSGLASATFIGTVTYTPIVPALTPNTTYYFRIVATNALGTTYGVILSFTTLP